MTTAPAILIRRASRLLNDQEEGHSYVAWSASELLEWFNEALCMIYQLRPTEFSQCVTLTLKPGSKQELEASCGTLLSIDSNLAESSTGGEAEGSSVTMSTSDMMKAFGGKKSCANTDNCADFEIDSWRIHSGASRIFFVQPPVPEGVEVKVQATVSKPPSATSICDASADVNPLDCGFDSAIVDWMLWRAYGRDTESQFNYNIARRHQAAFYDSINGGYVSDSRVRSGYILGQTGTDPDSRNGWRHDIRNVGR